MSDNVFTSDLPAGLAEQEDREEDGHQGAVYPGDQQEAVIVLVRPAERGQHHGTN